MPGQSPACLMNSLSRRVALTFLGTCPLAPSTALSRPQRAAHPPTASDPAHGGRPGAYAQRADVRDWVNAQTAAQGALAGWAADTVLQRLGEARYQRRVAQLILPPPVGVAKDWNAYRQRFIEPRRLQAGLRFWAEHADALARAESRFGVPASLVLGILGVETFYGQIMGGFRVLDALATLAFDFPRGRSDRSSFFREELAAFLLLAQAEGRPVTTFKGSFAGAMGLGQFMPSSWRRHAIDFDGDGHIDLVANPSDAIGSVANFLREHGWTPGLATHWTVDAPSDPAEKERLLGAGIEPRWSAADLQALTLPEPVQAGVAAQGPWAFVQLENGGAAPPSHLLGSRNFWVVTRYNRSAYYALAVIELGEELARLRSAGLAD